MIGNYDIIPDIHADFTRLVSTLRRLGYHEDSSGWFHPEGRKAAFLGDFIDSGPKNLKVVKTVRSMVEAGNAVAIMGNHELNAILYHTPGESWLGQRFPDKRDGFMRANDEDNRRQHATFLKAAEKCPGEAQEALHWFMTLPMFIDLGDLRLVHACWDGAHIELIRQRRPNGRLRHEDLQEVALEETPFAKAIVNLLKGPEVKLPDGCSFQNPGDKERYHVRFKWWASPGATWREATLSVKDPSQLPEGAIDQALGASLYRHDAPPVFFGHYKRKERPRAPDAHNVMCLDYPAVYCAYRWDGEASLSQNSLIVVDPDAA